MKIIDILSKVEINQPALRKIAKWLTILFAAIIIICISIDIWLPLLFRLKPESIGGKLLSVFAAEYLSTPIEYYLDKTKLLLWRVFIFLTVFSLSFLLIYANIYLVNAGQNRQKLMGRWDAKQVLNITQIALVLWILFGFFVLNYYSAQNLSLTVDEKKHYHAGLRYSRFNSDLNGCCYMPFSILNAIPRNISYGLPDSSIKDYLFKQETGRISTMVVAIPLGLITFIWARKLYGFIPGLFALLLLVFDPNIIAHSQLITTDIYAACTITFATYAFWRFMIVKNSKYAVFSGLALGISLISKYASFYLFPVFSIIWIAIDGPKLISHIRKKDSSEAIRICLDNVKYAGIILAFSLLLLNAGYFFNGSFSPLKSYEFTSETFKSMQSRFTLLDDIPLPLPKPYVESLDLANYLERTGKGNGLVYLNGRLSLLGFEGYYFYASVYKVPIATLLMIFLSFGAYFLLSRKRDFLHKELFLIVPIVIYSIYFNYIFRSQIGIRHFLVVFPFIYIFIGSLFQKWRKFNIWQVAGISGLVIYLAISVHSYYPHYIAYFNEFIGDRTYSYKVLADSNLDWGQGQKYLSKYLDEHPDVIIEPTEPVAGTILVPANKLLGITGDPQQYKWLRKNFNATDTVAYYYLIFEISPEEVKPFQ